MRKPRTVSRLVLWLVGFFAFLNVYAVQPVTPLIIDEFNATSLQAGTLVGATVLGIAISSLFVGMLSDAIGRKGVIVIAMFALVVPTMWIQAADSLALITALRFLQGLAIPGITTALMAYVAEELPAAKISRGMAAYLSGCVLGGFSGRFITAYASEWLGWRGGFMTLAVLTMVGALAVQWRLPASANFIAHRNLVFALGTLAGHLKNTGLLTACSVGFCTLFSLVGSFTYVALHLAQAPYLFSPKEIGNVFVIYLVGVVATLLAGGLISRLGIRAVLTGSLVCSSLGILLTLSPTVLAIMLGLTVCSCGAFFAQAATFSFIAERVKEGRSLAAGIYNATYYIGGALGAWLCGVAYLWAGWKGTVMLVLLSQAAATAIAWIGSGPAEGRRPAGISRKPL